MYQEMLYMSQLVTRGEVIYILIRMLFSYYLSHLITKTEHILWTLFYICKSTQKKPVEVNIVINYSCQEMCVIQQQHKLRS